MLKKRGQLTIFIIIAVVIVIALTAYFFFQKSNIETSKDNEKISILRENTLDCFNQIYVSSLIHIGFQGGFQEVNNGVYNGFAFVPYYYKQGENLAPNIQQVETEITKYIDNNIEKCFNYKEIIANSEELGFELKNIDLINETFIDYDISYTDYKTTVLIDKNKVIFTTDILLTIKDNQSNTYQIDFSEYPKSVQSDLFSMHEIATYISNSLYENNEELCLNCVYDLAKEKKLNVEMMGYLTNNDELVIISNNATSSPFVFQFINKYKEVKENNETLF